LDIFLSVDITEDTKNIRQVWRKSDDAISCRHVFSGLDCEVSSNSLSVNDEYYANQQWYEQYGQSIFGITNMKAMLIKIMFSHS